MWYSQDVMANRTNLTAKKRAAFCELLAATGNVTKSAQAIGVSRTCCYDHKDNDPVFAKAWENAVDDAVDALEEEGRRRAFEGVREPVYYQGNVCGHIQKYSDTLLMFLMKGHRPETYRERSHIEHTGEGGGPVQFIMVPDKGANGNGKRKAKAGRLRLDWQKSR